MNCLGGWSSCSRPKGRRRWQQTTTRRRLVTEAAVRIRVRDIRNSQVLIFPPLPGDDTCRALEICGETIISPPLLSLSPLVSSLTFPLVSSARTVQALGILLALVLALNARWATAKFVGCLRERRRRRSGVLRRVGGQNDLRGLEEGLWEALRVRPPSPHNEDSTTRPPTPPPPPPSLEEASQSPPSADPCDLCLAGLRRVANFLAPRTVYAYPGQDEEEEGWRSVTLRKVKRGSGRKVTAELFREHAADTSGEGRSFLGTEDLPLPQPPTGYEDDMPPPAREDVIRILPFFIINERSPYYSTDM